VVGRVIDDPSVLLDISQPRCQWRRCLDVGTLPGGVPGRWSSTIGSGRACGRGGLGRGAGADPRRGGRSTGCSAGPRSRWPCSGS